jgi:hypothetical protein
MVCSGCISSSNNNPENQCQTCVGTSGKNDQKIVQKQMWQQVRVPSSLYTMNLAALTIVGVNSPPNWNPSSDQKVPSVQTAYHPSHGNSTKATLTSAKPGSCAPAGSGVDIKHNSYARYLGKKKAINIRTQKNSVIPVEGNKTRKYGIIANSENCLKCP